MRSAFCVRPVLMAVKAMPLIIVFNKVLNMNFLKKTILPILLATIWISVSEFVRNELLVKSYWTEHYKNLGLVFPSEPINGALWGLWSLFFAIVIFIISKKFSLIQTTLLSWFVGFVLMWLVIGNLGVLPMGLLYVAIPLSLLEVFLAAFIIVKLQR
jgi:hypothetical protein